MHGVLHISYTMCTRGLPDIYTLSPRACGPRASGVYIRQTTRAHGITIKYGMVSMHVTLWHGPTHVTLYHGINACHTIA